MGTQATYDDANLILRLYEIRREDKMRAARSWFASTFRPKTIEEMNLVAAPGSPENANMRQVTSYFEMVASFVTAGVLNKELTSSLAANFSSPTSASAPSSPACAK